MITSRRQTVIVASLLTAMTMVILALVASYSFAGAYVTSPTSSPHADTPAPTESLQLTLTPTPDPAQVLDLLVSWDSPLEPPQTAFTITIEMRDTEATSGDWVLGDASGDIAGGQLSRGESETVALDVDWSQRPWVYSSRWFYVFGRGDDGSTFAQVFNVDFARPVPAGVSPSPTASCGYARFVITTETDVNLVFPDQAFEVGLANEGILTCGTLDWVLVENTRHPDVLSCSPTSGVLEGSRPGEEANVTSIQCTIDWREIGPEQVGDIFLVLFSFPRVNGKDSAHLIHIHTTPSGQD